MLVRSVRPSPAWICGNESQPGLQILEKLATSMRLVRTLYKTDISLRRTHSAGRKGHKRESTVALY